MSAADKSKLDGVEAGAQVNTVTQQDMQEQFNVLFALGG